MHWKIHCLIIDKDVLIDERQNGTRIDLEIHDRGLRFSHDVGDSARGTRILSAFLPRGAVPVTRKSSQMFARNPSPLTHEKRGRPASHMRLCRKWIKSTLQFAPFAPTINKDLLRNRAISYASPIK